VRLPARCLPTLALGLAPLAAQSDYRLPPQAVIDLVDAPPPPDVELSPDGRWLLTCEREALPPIRDLARRMLRLAGLRIDPVANAPFATGGFLRVAVRASGSDGPDVAVALPEGARVRAVDWASDSRRFALTVATAGGSELWVASPEDPRAARRLLDRLHTVLGAPRWTDDGTALLARAVSAERGAEPAAPEVPAGPEVEETSGAKTPLRTYQDLLASAHDEALFDHYAAAEVVLVGADDGAVSTLARGIHLEAELSPDGRYLLEVLVERPYSYRMPVGSFPQRIQVRPVAGGAPTVLFEVPLATDVPIDGVRTGPRQIGWHASEPATLVWCEALDDGDPERDVPHRDRWCSLAAPFALEEARELVRVEERARGIAYLPDPRLLVTTEYDRDRRWTRTLLHELGRDSSPRALEDRSVRDRYGDPGALVFAPGARGRRLLWLRDGWLYRAGEGATSAGALPFLRRQSLATLATEELWRCASGCYERVVALLPGDDDAPRFVTSHEDPSSPPNLRLRVAGREEVVRWTEFSDPTPSLRAVEKRLVRYPRADGVELSGTLYLPPGTAPGARLPLLVWAYPIEFNDPATAGQVAGSPWRFTTVRGASHLALVTQGFAVLDGATMPIVGDAETMNDTFREQVVASAEAALAHLSDEGLVDRGRALVGGHSYGAFMTANLLAHSDLFRAGIARSGAYNRTLTPFGFQSERRTLWQARDTYVDVSPYLCADEIDEPLLLIHGERDDNSGTFPMQSENLFQAIAGNGGTARLVLLPLESHGYRARESVLHVLAEMVDWCRRYTEGE